MKKDRAAQADKDANKENTLLLIGHMRAKQVHENGSQTGGWGKGKRIPREQKERGWGGGGGGGGDLGVSITKRSFKSSKMGQGLRILRLSAA